LSKTFYWHDYETWGADQRRDRPCQFAGLRTDEDLNPVGEPLILFCRPADDLLPHPDACLLTGISPQRAWREGVTEADFAAAIDRELAKPGTCGVGYNSIRFDDEITRNLFYRNFIDPYAASGKTATHAGTSSMSCAWHMPCGPRAFSGQPAGKALLPSD
jgi:exodeoxyribonuclease-1